MYPLWQHRPHGILVHYSVAVCAKKKKNGQKEMERKKQQQAALAFRRRKFQIGMGIFPGQRQFQRLLSVDGSGGGSRLAAPRPPLLRIALPKRLKLEITRVRVRGPRRLPDATPAP